MKERLEAEALAVAQLKANLDQWRGGSSMKPVNADMAVIADMRDKNGFESSLYFSKGA